jgi:hypothetical protein
MVSHVHEVQRAKVSTRAVGGASTDRGISDYAKAAVVTLLEAGCTTAEVQAITHRGAGASQLAVLVGTRLLYRLELAHGHISAVLIIGEEMFATAPRFAHQTHRLLTELIASERYIITIA